MKVFKIMINKKRKKEDRHEMTPLSHFLYSFISKWPGMAQFRAYEHMDDFNRGVELQRRLNEEADARR